MYIALKLNKQCDVSANFHALIKKVLEKGTLSGPQLGASTSKCLWDKTEIQIQILRGQSQTHQETAAIRAGLADLLNWTNMS